MTWNSKQIRACRERVANGQYAMIDEACGAPFDVVMSYGAWDGTNNSGAAHALDTALSKWLCCVQKEEAHLARTPAQPKWEGITEQRVTFSHAGVSVEVVARAAEPGGLVITVCPPKHGVPQ